MTIIFTADNTENMNTMVRIFDHTFRSIWNVFGGKRISSWKEDGMLKVKMHYSASETFTTLKTMREIANNRLCRVKAYCEEDMWYEEV